MKAYEIRNKKTGVIMGQVHTDNYQDVLPTFAEMCGCTIDDIADSLGQSVEEAKAALDIVEIDPRPVVVAVPTRSKQSPAKKTLDHLPRRWA